MATMFISGKESLRKSMLAKRNSLSPKEIESKSAEICEKIMSLREVQGASRIAAYLSLPQEVSTRELISKLILAGKEVFVPFMDGEAMKFTKFTSFSDTATGSYKVPEPIQKNEVDASTINLFIIPGLAFDSAGFRLGWGKGFYDRFFSRLPSRKAKVGTCFDFQLVEKVPREKHDVQMDVVVSEKRSVIAKV